MKAITNNLKYLKLLNLFLFVNEYMRTKSVFFIYDKYVYCMYILFYFFNFIRVSSEQNKYF